MNQEEGTHPRAIVLIIAAALIVAATAVAYYFYSGQVFPTDRSVDAYASEVAHVRTLLDEGRIDEARALFENLDKSTMSPAQQAMVDTVLAGVMLEQNMYHAAALYAAVAANANYPAKSRAYAILEFAGRYYTQTDPDLAEPLLSPAELEQYDTVQERYLALCQKSYALYRFGLASAVIARSEIEKLIPEYQGSPAESEERKALSEQANNIASPYLAEIERLMPDILPPDMKSGLYPVTLLAKAVLLYRLEGLGVDTAESPSAGFEAAITAAGELGYEAQEEFATLYYVGYLSRVSGQEGKVIELLSGLASRPRTPEFTKYMESPSFFAGFTGLQSLAEENAEIAVLLRDLGAAV